MTDLTLEKDVQRACVAILEGLGARVYVTSQYRASRVTAGIPDLYALHPKLGGVWVEVKRPGGKQSSEQAAFERSCEIACVEYWLVDSETALRERLTDAGVLRGE